MYSLSMDTKPYVFTMYIKNNELYDVSASLCLHMEGVWTLNAKITDILICVLMFFANFQSSLWTPVDQTTPALCVLFAIKNLVLSVSPHHSYATHRSQDGYIGYLEFERDLFLWWCLWSLGLSKLFIHTLKTPNALFETKAKRYISTMSVFCPIH